ncbi:BON domain-containing protein [Ideonella sp. 4Y16]|uniref:BON domain-containing protein n=1 Tax=Ideonella alba TaxID=2824118 RepID=A0A940Y4N9_9BURK|nr:BON domain-containing protein [Ideonella alba]MBQ0930159.1 BON domain-containing protein [Ideonella alba]MBQ0943227.1 BON domain-containing protein [Ideonella alba]
MNPLQHRVSTRVLLSALALSGLLAGCAPLLLGGAAVGGALMYKDRRTTGTQLEDEGIEIKAAARLRERLGDKAHLNVTSYNRIALVTGEVATDGDRAAVEEVVAKVENVRSVVNESAVMGITSMTARSNDLIITSRVKAALIDANDLPVTAVKVVTERGVVYLLGRVTEREATRATDVARGVSGVAKVVKVFETLTEDELKALSTEKR